MRRDSQFRSSHPSNGPTAPCGPRIAEAGSTHIEPADAHQVWASITVRVPVRHANAIWGTLPAYQIPAVSAANQNAVLADLHCGGEV